MSEKDYFISFAAQLGELNGNIASVLKRLEKGYVKLTEHEARLAKIEHERRKEHDEPLKDWLIKRLTNIIGFGIAAAACTKIGVDGVAEILRAWVAG